jgi:hypothetical protein
MGNLKKGTGLMDKQEQSILSSFIERRAGANAASNSLREKKYNMYSIAEWRELNSEARAIHTQNLHNCMRKSKYNFLEQYEFVVEEMRKRMARTVWVPIVDFAQLLLTLEKAREGEYSGNLLSMVARLPHDPESFQRLAPMSRDNAEYILAYLTL